MMHSKRPNDVERAWVDRKGEPINVDRAWQKSDARIALTRREQAMLAAAGMDGPEAQWYVLRVEERADIAVDKLLECANVERWMATKSVLPPRRSDRKKQRSTPVLMPALPGYVFVRVVSCALTWAGLKTVKGVVDVLGGADNPKPVKAGEILKLQAFIEKNPRAIEVLTNALKVGDKVSIDSGPFTAFEAIVLMLGDAERIKVEATLFGRATPLELDLAQVTKLD
ncbi:transcription termination/antitermination protein NusG [Mesorhizobium sp.]|uniref:transcription termination/antitermination protein NusG n=1 Tax=Mesorhizobium sp. TaxID=1871066 RepID=UPI000FE4EECC|nr:transcription termination/antitermination protein NusG [Mesorhizobium sp.]RWO90913.1 MAG: transcriptional antiterminator NusG [Mesorhizobium sp.]